jgi:hypothetical protein
MISVAFRGHPDTTTIVFGEGALYKFRTGVESALHGGNVKGRRTVSDFEVDNRNAGKGYNGSTFLDEGLEDLGTSHSNAGDDVDGARTTGAGTSVILTSTAGAIMSGILTSSTTDSAAIEVRAEDFSLVGVGVAVFAHCAASSTVEAQLKSTAAAELARRTAAIFNAPWREPTPK